MPDGRHPDSRPFHDREHHPREVCCASCKARLFRIEQAVGVIAERLDDLAPVLEQLGPIVDTLAGFKVDDLPAPIRRLLGM